MRREMDRCWDVPGIDLSYQFSQSVEDSITKVKRAVSRGVDTILATGGDGTISTVGRVLVNTEISLGAVPVGSGNGFARHFGIPLSPVRAVQALAQAQAKRIDVGIVNDIPFLVTCSMAWDASLVRSFEKMPVRGIVPYIFAGVSEFLEYKPQAMHVRFDTGEELSLPDPLVFTVANLTQYGGGARIAPHARPDDGCLELVVVLREDVPKLITNIGRFFDGTIRQIPQVISRTFKSMTVRRKQHAPIQMDGELVDAPAEIEVRVMGGALKVLAPKA
jgi:YegS/Rv2252/BmrU family lipid kinase